MAEEIKKLNFIILHQGYNIRDWSRFEGTKEEAIAECRRDENYDDYGYSRAILIEYKPIFEIGIEPVEKKYNEE